MRGLLALWGLACGACDPPASQAKETVAIAEPHMEDFARYASWVQRALHSHPAAHSSALKEVLFSPLRLESDVLDAYVVLRDRPVRQFALRKRGTERPEAAQLPEVEGGDHEGLRAARSRCQERRGRPQDVWLSCVWLAREFPAQHGQPGWMVWVAYRSAPAAAAK